MEATGTHQEPEASQRVPHDGHTPPESRFRPDIEGLRAVAVLAVVLFHAGIPGLDGGFVGVDVFFVISGFLITGLLWREATATGTIRFRNFYGARARRLLPASATVGVVTMVAAALLLPAMQVKSVAMDGITSALYVSNYWFIGSGVNYFGKESLLAPSPFQHYWSLGVEEQFYLVWPLLIVATAWLLRKVRRHRAETHARNLATSSVRPYLVLLAVIAAVSFTLSLVLTLLLPPVAYFSLPTRAWQLAAGGLVALTVLHWRRLSRRIAVATGWAGMVLIVLACTQLNGDTAYPGVAALLPTLGTVLVIGAGCAAPTRGCGRLLSSKPMGAIGRMSYSWYLWHWPVLVLAPVLVGHRLGLIASLVAVAVSAALAALTLRFIENPLRFAPRIRSSARNSLLLGAVATAVAVAVCAVVLVRVPAPAGRGPAVDPPALAAVPVPAAGASPQAYDAAVRETFGEVQAAVAASRDVQVVPSNPTPPLTGGMSEQMAIVTGGCLRVMPFDSEQPECTVGDPDSPTRVALIGDSRAAMFNPAFQKLAEQRQWRLTMMAKAGCPITDLPITRQLNGLAEGIFQCGRWRERIIDRLRADPHQLIVVGSARAYDANGSHTMAPGLKMFDEAWMNSLTGLVRELRETGAQVLVLGPTPDLPASAPTCLAGHLDDATTCADVWDAAEQTKRAHGMAEEAAATRAAGGQYADLTELFCTDNRCPAIVGNILVYFDSGHMTQEYARFIAPALGAVADRALALG